MTDELFPKPRRRMKQPRKDTLRDELARAAETIEQQSAEIIGLRAEIAMLRRPWWRRLADALGLRPSGGFSGHGDSWMRADKR